MRGRNLILTLALALAAGATPAGAATQAASHRRTVDASDVPSLHQVDRITPVSSRGIEDDGPIWIFRPDCSAYDPTHGPQGIESTFAYYYGAGDTDPTAYVRVHEFASVGDAKRAIRKIRHNAASCYGVRHDPVINGTLIVRGADVPSLGAGRPAAWKINDHWRDIDTHMRNVLFSRHIWMREGRTLVGVELWVQTVGPHDPPPISRSATIRLARLALRTND
ncbi:hypothetical protein [Nocardioides sp. MH1]|uniref:hypothetical protein n=1 Tax=Nocardioides sp. MH1 TaxID=3242490 RepID=UPI0035221D2B